MRCIHVVNCIYTGRISNSNKSKLRLLYEQAHFVVSATKVWLIIKEFLSVATIVTYVQQTVKNLISKSFHLMSVLLTGCVRYCFTNQNAVRISNVLSPL